jgi:hypothetical protein
MDISRGIKKLSWIRHVRLHPLAIRFWPISRNPVPGRVILVKLSLNHFRNTKQSINRKLVLSCILFEYRRGETKRPTRKTFKSVERQTCDNYLQRRRNVYGSSRAITMHTYNTSTYPRMVKIFQKIKTKYILMFISITENVKYFYAENMKKKKKKTETR